MDPNQPHFSPSAPQEQPFPGAVTRTTPPTHLVPQPRQTVMEIPSPLPRASFLFRTDGRLSDDAHRVLSQWSGWLEETTKNIPTSLIRGRLCLLNAACKKQDVLYIVMHHRFCTWSRNHSAAHHLMQQFAPPDVVDRGFAALEILLKSNSHLSPAQLDWFSNFPAPTFDSFIPSPILASLTRRLVEFISAFSFQWPTFAPHIVHRGFPILAWEIGDALKCSSAVAQNVLFNLSRRLLGCPDGPPANALSDLFDRDRHFELARLSNHCTADHVNQQRAALANNYIGLLRQFRAQAETMAATRHAAQSSEAPTARGQAATERSHIPSNQPQPQRAQFNQVPMSTTSSSLSQNVIVPSMQNQASRLPTPSGKTVPSTARPTGPARNERPRPAQNTSLPTAHPTLPGPTPVQSRDTPMFIAQQLQDPRLAENLAACLNPKPGNVFRRIPESEYPQSAYDLPSLKVGLHLARQRSPRRMPRTLEPTRYFQHVDNIIVQPTKLDMSSPLTDIKFSLSEDQSLKLPVPQVEFDVCNLPVVRFEDSTLRYRVRVCQLPSTDSVMSESKWVRASVFWPAELHFTINEMPCLLSRKQHFRTDLPAEISAHIKSGDNELRVSLPSLTHNERGYDYFIAVEQVTVQRYASVWRIVNGYPHISAEATRDRIKHFYRLTDNNEISVIGSTLNISVCDPISSKVCTVPVRGINCKHIDCFDLENWLHSRPGKPRTPPSEPCLVDCWACPICEGDARPNQLRICDYFSQVVKQLHEAGYSETRTIAISEKGDWQPQHGTFGLHKGEASSQPGAPGHPSHSAEVIEILDDDD